MQTCYDPTCYCDVVSGPTLTPVKNHNGIFVKRDDLFEYGGVRGGKVRTCLALAQGAKGLVTAGSRSSPQCNIVAHVAKALGIPARVHTPKGALSPELIAAQQAGAKVIQHGSGYNSVIIKRAKDDAILNGYTNIPFGMQCREAVAQTAAQIRNLPFGQFNRIVMPVGSGMSLAGVVEGLRHTSYAGSVKVLGVVVGALPTKRLDMFTNSDLNHGWRSVVTLVNAGLPYHKPAAVTQLGGLQLDPIYEAKCLPFLKVGDLFWVVGIRQTVNG